MNSVALQKINEQKDGYNLRWLKTFYYTNLSVSNSFYYDKHP